MQPNLNTFGDLPWENSILLCCWATLVKQLVLNPTRGQGHAWDLDSSLLMARPVPAPPALVLLVLRFPPPPPAHIVSSTLDLLLLPTLFVFTQYVTLGDVSPHKTLQNQQF